jgi:hypothetical protein
VQDRDTEHGHHRIADELLNRAAMALDRCLHRFEVAGHHLAQALGVKPLAERGRAGHIAEDDSDCLSQFAAAGLLHRERGGAPPAEARTVRVLGAAIRADQHKPSLGRTWLDESDLAGLSSCC